MDFISTGLWWAFFIPASTTFSVYSLARRNRELGVKWLNMWGGLCAWISLVFVILTFVFSGWKGGVAVLIGMVSVALVVVLIVGRIFVKRSPIHRQEFTIPTSVEELAQLSEQMDTRLDEIVSEISNQPKILIVLQRHGKKPEYVRDVHRKLVLNNAGTDVAESVIQNPKLLNQYLQMEADGVPPKRIAFNLLKSLGR